MMNKKQPAALMLNPESLLKQLTANLNVGIMLADLQGNVVFRSNVFEQWIPTLILENKLWIMQLLPFLSPEQQCEFAGMTTDDLLQRESEKEMVLEATHLNSKVFFRIKVYPYYDEQNVKTGLLEITENITDLKELDKSLQHARRFETVGRLASGIAHDFNNILQVINGHSEILLETHKSNDKLTRSLELVLASGQKASLLTRQLL